MNEILERNRIYRQGGGSLSARSTSARAFLTGSFARPLLSNRAERELGRLKGRATVSINERQWAGVNPGTIGPRVGD